MFSGKTLHADCVFSRHRWRTFGRALCFNAYADELFVSIFHSFKAGITNAISSFK